MTYLLFPIGLFIGFCIGYFAGLKDYISFSKPYWDSHLEEDKRWKRHVAKEYKKWKQGGK